MESILPRPFTNLSIIEQKPLNELSVGFFIDVSGSTGGSFVDDYIVLDIEKQLAQFLGSSLKIVAPIVAWETTAKKVSSLTELSPNGGTSPSSIFVNDDSLCVIKNIEVAVIITDGQIDPGEIKEFAKCMTIRGNHLKSIIGVIVGRRGNDHNSRMIKPSDVNVSVLAPAMIADSCILFYNGKDAYVMWACGVFEQTWTPTEITDAVDWSRITIVTPQQITQTMVPIMDHVEKVNLLMTGYIPFGSGKFFNPEHLLQSSPAWDELLSYPLNRISLYFKATNQYDRLIDWFKIQKDRFILEFMTDPAETENINRMIYALEHRERPQEELSGPVQSFIRSRNLHLARRYVIQDNEDEHLLEDPRAIQLVQFFRNIMQVMEEDRNAQYNGASYTASTMGTSRYSSIPFRSGSPISSNMESITADFSEPYKWFKQFKNKIPAEAVCLICCEPCVPFILVRKHIDKDHINDILNNLLTYFYQEPLCSKCADIFCHRQQDPVRVFCFAAFPIICLDDDSKQKFLHCFAKLTNYQCDPSPDTSYRSSALYQKIKNLWTPSSGGEKTNESSEIIKTIHMILELLANYYTIDKYPPALIEITNQAKECFKS